MARPQLTAEVYQREDDWFDWRVLHRNGQIVATSGGQGYTRRADAHRSLDRFLGHVMTGSVEVVVG